MGRERRQLSFEVWPGVERHGDHRRRRRKHVRIQTIDEAAATTRVGKPQKHLAKHRGVEETLGCFGTQHAAGEERRRRRTMNRDVIGMIVAAVRFERQHDMRPDVRDDRPQSRFDVEHVDVRERMRIVVTLPLFARRIVEPQQHRFLDPEPCARAPELLDAQRTEVVNGADRRMRFSGFAVGGADERDARPAIAQVREHAAVEDLVVGMSQRDEE